MVQMVCVGRAGPRQFTPRFSCFVAAPSILQGTDQHDMVEAERVALRRLDVHKICQIGDILSGESVDDPAQGNCHLWVMR